MNRREFIKLASLSPLIAFVLEGSGTGKFQSFEKHLTESDLKNIESDYQKGDIVIYNGWVLSRHEVRILKRMSLV